jgi:hypothetical protein
VSRNVEQQDDDGLQPLRHQRPDLSRACQSGASTGLAPLAGISCAGRWRSSTDRLLRERCTESTLTPPVHFATPTHANHDDARVQPNRSVERCVLCAATCNTSRSAVEGRTADSASTGTRLIRHHHTTLESNARKSPSHKLSIAAFRSQESRAEAESSSHSRFCLHDSCDTSFRQRPKECPAERQLKSKADDRRDQFPLRFGGGWLPGCWRSPSRGLLNCARTGVHSCQHFQRGSTMPS